MMNDLRRADASHTRADAPHTAVIKIQIRVHKTFKDGSLDPNPIKTDELNKYGIGPFADMKIEGFDKTDCIKKVKERLEKLNG